MESLDLQLWTHIGAMNRHSAVRCPRFSVSLRFGHPKGWTPNTRFMESLDLQLWTRIGTMNRHSAVRCPRFSVSLRFWHPKGWTPNRRFMEKPPWSRVWTGSGWDDLRACPCAQFRLQP